MNDFILLHKLGEDGMVAVSISDISCISDEKSMYYDNRPYSRITLKNGISCSVIESAENIVNSIHLASVLEEQ